MVGAAFWIALAPAIVMVLIVLAVLLNFGLIVLVEQIGQALAS